MENSVVELSPSSKHIWRIRNFSKLGAEEHFSDYFSSCGCKWRMSIWPKGMDNGNHLAVFLYAKDSASRHAYVEFSLGVVKQIGLKATLTKDVTRQLTEKSSAWGYRLLLPLSELNDPDKGYLLDDTCIINLEISISRMVKNSTNVSLKSETELQAVIVNAPLEEKNPANESVAEVEKQKKPDNKRKGSLISEEAPRKVQIVEHPSAGNPFERRNNHRATVLDDEKFEDIGGFSIMKEYTTLYNQIWLKYGHIASNQIVTDSSYLTQVCAVADIMSSIKDMNDCCLVDVSSEMVDRWEEKIQMAEKLEFNIKWLRERFEDIKRLFSEMQKFKTAFLEHGQPLQVAKAQVIAAEDELKKAQARLLTQKEEFRGHMSSLLSEMEIDMYLDKGDSRLLNGML